MQGYFTTDVMPPGHRELLSGERVPGSTAPRDVGDRQSCSAGSASRGAWAYIGALAGASPGEHVAHRDVEASGGVGSPKIYRLSI
jgi:hypothetical protein